MYACVCVDEEEIGGRKTRKSKYEDIGESIKRTKINAKCQLLIDNEAKISQGAIETRGRPSPIKPDKTASLSLSLCAYFSISSRAVKTKNTKHSLTVSLSLSPSR